MRALIDRKMRMNKSFFELKILTHQEDNEDSFVNGAGNANAGYFGVAGAP